MSEGLTRQNGKVYAKDEEQRGGGGGLTRALSSVLAGDGEESSPREKNVLNERSGI